jgi:hypothetical protein
MVVGCLELTNLIYVQAMSDGIVKKLYLAGSTYLKLSMLRHRPVWSMLIGSQHMEKQNVIRLYWNKTMRAYRLDK